MRHQEEKEKIEFFAHSATCKYCEGIVKMNRNIKTYELEPNNCYCFGCGQRYYCEVDNLTEFESQQWQQKNNMEFNNIVQD